MFNGGLAASHLKEYSYMSPSLKDTGLGLGGGKKSLVSNFITIMK